jgi:hypothetical protein
MRDVNLLNKGGGSDLTKSPSGDALRVRDVAA